MSSLGSLYIGLSLDTVQFQDGLSKSEYQTRKFTRQFEANFSRAQEKARQFSERTTQYLNNIEKAANNINSTTKWSFRLDNLGRAQDLSKQAIAMMDSYTELQNRIRLVTHSQTEMAQATESVFDISSRTNQAVGATAQIYQRFAKNADTLNISQQKVVELTETVSKAVALSGAAQASSEAALMQFGQALASGELRGAELNSVMEQTPALAQAIADGLGVSVGALKDMGKNGELSINKVITALEKAKSSVDSDFEKRVKTLSMSYTNLETSFIKYAGEADRTYGITQKLGESVDFVSNNLDQLITAAVVLTGALAVGRISQYSAELAKSGIISAKNALAHTAEAKSIYERATAMRVAAQFEMSSLTAQLQLAQSEQTRFALRERMKVQSAQIIALAEAEAAAKRNLATATNLATMAAKGLQSVMALLGGPAGVIGIAATSLLFFSSQAAEARQWALDTSVANQALAESYDQITEAALSLKITKQLENIEKYYAEIEKLKAGIATKQVGADFDGISVGGNANDAEIESLKNKIQVIKENADIARQSLEKMLSPLGEKMLRAGKNVDDVRQKFKLLGVSAETADNIIANLPKSFNDTANSANKAADKTLDLKDAMEKLKEKSTSLAQKLEVAKLKQQGQAKSAYVLAGLYELLGKEGAEYNEVLIGIATGTITAANAADKAVGLSLETLNKILAGKATLEKMFSDETKVTTIETQIKESNKKSGENARDSWLSFYDEIRKKSSSSLAEIDLEQTRMFQRLEEHNKKGVVSHQEYETAKTAITERFARQRLELAGKYAPEKLLRANLNDELAVVEELKKAGQLTGGEANTAELQLKFDYAQNRSQSAVNPLDQLRALYDPQQELINQQTQELAQLQAFNDQKLITEEEFQQRKQQIIDKYKNNKIQKEMESYATGLNDLGGAFGTLASMVEQSAGKQSAAYKAMFAISKAFAIAEATVKLSQAVMQAMADDTAFTPAQKFANMAAVAAAGANVISQITSVGFAKGGHVVGEGTGTSDSILARLSNNEFVMTSRTVDHYGVGFMNALNQRRFPKFANGGHVGGKSDSYDGLFSGGGASTNNEVSITINIDKNGNESVTAEQKAAQGKELALAIQANVLEVLREQRRPGGMLG
uniref:Tail tape measure n=1 Tax=Siphoviridae sp. ct0qt9 TaxID=2825298 RepID=A0A8S5P0T9_9CAUD|nr:MAG TPA: Tail tape measure [Siphoviridae sp. ct0qt9]